jgi:DNA-binding transcriptional LysR family regulator
VREVLFVAGEASGDLHAAGVAAELRALRPDLAMAGIGYLPQPLAERYVAQGKLVIKRVAEPKPEVISYIAWCSEGGKAQQWLLQALEQLTLEQLLM